MEEELGLVGSATQVVVGVVALVVSPLNGAYMIGAGCSRIWRLLTASKNVNGSGAEGYEVEEKRSSIVGDFSKYGVHSLWHISHVDNVKNILTHGILNHHDAYRLNHRLVDISDPGAQKWREREDPIYKRKIHEYAPLYINQKNPMLYLRKELQRDLCLIEVSVSSIIDGRFLISDGNAASRDTAFYPSAKDLGCLPWDVIRAESWTAYADGKRKRCAEVLVFPSVEPAHIKAVHCCSDRALKVLSGCGHRIIFSRNLFF